MYRENNSPPVQKRSFFFVLSPSIHSSKGDGGVFTNSLSAEDGGKDYIFLGVLTFPTHPRFLQHIIIAFLILQIDFASAASEIRAKGGTPGGGRKSLFPPESRYLEKADTC